MPNYGKPTNSLVSNIYIHGTQRIEPKVGMGVTVPMWTDRKAGTIIACTDRTLTIQFDTTKRVDKNGMSDMQTYEYTPNPDGSIRHFTLRQNGYWVEKGTPMKNGQHLILDRRDAYHDYSF